MGVRVVLAGMLGILAVGMSVIREFKILHVVVCISDVFLDIDINITKVRPIYGDVLPVWRRLLTGSKCSAGGRRRSTGPAVRLRRTSEVRLK